MQNLFVCTTGMYCVLYLKNDGKGCLALHEVRDDLLDQICHEERYLQKRDEGCSQSQTEPAADTSCVKKEE